MGWGRKAGRKDMGRNKERNERMTWKAGKEGRIGGKERRERKDGRRRDNQKRSNKKVFLGQNNTVTKKKRRKKGQIGRAQKALILFLFS